MTKQEILDKFSDIDFAYNDSSKHETLSRMLDELLQEQETEWCDRCGRVRLKSGRCVKDKGRGGEQDV